MAPRSPRTSRAATRAAAAIAGLIALCGAIPQAAIAQDQPSGESDGASNYPSAESVFEDHFNAIGGREAIAQHTRLAMRGVYEGPPFAGKTRLRVWREQPNQYHLRLADPLGEVFTSYDLVFDGTTPWQRTNDVESLELAGSRATSLRLDADFLGEVGSPGRYQSIETMGYSVYYGTPCIAVRAIPAIESRLERVLVFDRETGLLRGVRAPFEVPPKGFRALDLTFDDYREADGVLYPHKVQQRYVDEEPFATFIYQKITVNPEDAHDFAAPEDLKPAPAPEPGTDAPDQSGEGG